MKANEAPEKIYIQKFDVNEEESKFDKSKMFFDDVWVEEPEPSNNYIEYTRTDAFIEKAYKWFRRIDYDYTMPPYETTEEFIEGFKKAMKL